MSISKFWPTYPPLFLRTKIFLGPCQPIREFGTPAYLRSLKILPIDFSCKKPIEPNFQVISTLNSGFRVILRFFRKKFNGHYLHFGFSQFLFLGKSISPSVFKILSYVFCILPTTKLTIKILNGFFKFLPQKCFTALPSQKNL